MDIILFNTLGREKQVFKPIITGKAGLYTCGPTVYDYQHIGNFRTFLFEDFLKRILIYNGYDVTHIMNITDVGHLVSDGDEGEDKMEKGSARTGKTVWEIAEYYTKHFLEDAKALNIIPPTKYTKATDYINEQIDMIKCLDDKGYTYITSDGVYFDTSKLNDYGKLAKLDIEGLEEGSRIQFSTEKKNKTDFALWKFSPRNEKRQMEWESPWGKGFPGWHIECSAMSRKFLGDTFDIHCGGIDHIPIHHTNEIAQSEACTGKMFVHYWMHGAFLEEDSGKMSKSKGEFLRIETIIKKGYAPLDFRYLCLGTHYRKRLLFSWEILDQAKAAFSRLKLNVQQIRNDAKKNFDQRDASLPKEEKEKFTQAVNDDLNMPQAIAVLWGVIRNENLSSAEKKNLIDSFDRVLGLDLDKDNKTGDEIIPSEILEIVNERITAKKGKDFKKADELRGKLKDMGYEIVDKKDGAEVKKIRS
ncbi:MAG: cysteine--tRNA ligase [Ignavibacteria bacterium]|nr:cysteine--tRNA ligase [Ignavibacteria bacterium]